MFEIWEDKTRNLGPKLCGFNQITGNGGIGFSFFLFFPTVNSVHESESKHTHTRTDGGREGGREP